MRFSFIPSAAMWLFRHSDSEPAQPAECSTSRSISSVFEESFESIVQGSFMNPSVPVIALVGLYDALPAAGRMESVAKAVELFTSDPVPDSRLRTGLLGSETGRTFFNLLRELIAGIRQRDARVVDSVLQRATTYYLNTEFPGRRSFPKIKTECVTALLADTMIYSAEKSMRIRNGAAPDTLFPGSITELHSHIARQTGLLMGMTDEETRTSVQMVLKYIMSNTEMKEWFIASYEGHEKFAELAKGLKEARSESDIARLVPLATEAMIGDIKRIEPVA